MNKPKQGLITRSLALKELIRRRQLRENLPQVLDQNFPAQLAFIEDPSKLKAALCTRRAGKSYGCALYLVDEALKHPNSNLIYIALTRDSAKKILWKDCLKTINRKFHLNIRFNEAALIAYLPNGSQISLMGVDVSEKEKEKLLGQKFKLAIIDESASFNIDLRELVYGILKPALADYDGTICMIGTPGNITKSLYFDICNKIEPGWSLHQWSAIDNPYMREAWVREIEDIKKNRPLYEKTAQFKQHYLGEWVVDNTKLVYAYTDDVNKYHELPKHVKGDWVFNMGVDLGFNDATAFVIAAYHEHDNTLYIVNTYKSEKMDITDVANRITRYKREFNLNKVIVDGANKQAVAEIQNRHRIPLIAADKTGKSDFIAIMNSELVQGRIKLHDINGRHLKEEWENLIWEEKGEIRREHPNCDNHLSDAALYVWRHCYQYYSEESKSPPKPYTKEWYKQQEDEMEEFLLQKLSHSDDGFEFF